MKGVKDYEGPQHQVIEAGTGDQLSAATCWGRRPWGPPYSLARIMHHAERFCTSLQLACTGDPSVWIGERLSRPRRAPPG